MALINCPECKSEVSDKAEKCPKCAFPINPSESITKEVINDAGNKSSEGLFLKTMNTGCLVLIIIISISYYLIIIKL